MADMAQVEYRDLPEFGLRFVTPRQEQFAALVEDIRSRAMGPAIPERNALDVAAVVLNQSGKAILGMTVIWSFTDADSKPHDEVASSIGQQTLDILTGRAPLVLDRFSCIAPGSKRLVTPDGTFGDNSDVILSDPFQGHGVVFSGRSGGDRPREWKSAELTLDAALFEDGLCAGPDTEGTFERVRTEIEMQHSIAADLVAMFRRGATPGQIFERLLPDARQLFATPPEPHESGHSRARQRFAQSVISRYTHQRDEDLLAWLEKLAEPPELKLYRTQ
jgi:hypothetical protein